MGRPSFSVNPADLNRRRFYNWASAKNRTWAVARQISFICRRPRGNPTIRVPRGFRIAGQSFCRRANGAQRIRVHPRQSRPLHENPATDIRWKTVQSVRGHTMVRRQRKIAKSRFLASICPKEIAPRMVILAPAHATSA